jgi:polyisoprenoid-binding protein YceI
MKKQFKTPFKSKSFVITISSIFIVFTSLISCKKTEQEKQEYNVDKEQSSLIWKGHAKEHHHAGTFDISGKFLSDETNNVISGEFEIPIASIKNTDLPEPAKDQLLTHLKSPDFFNLALHPNANFKIAKSEPFNGTLLNTTDDANFIITGDFTLLGKKQSISFPAKITANHETISIDANITLDRHK